MQTQDHTLSAEQFAKAVQNETQKFQESYSWLEQAMLPGFYEEVGYDNLMLITHGLMGFPSQDFFTTIHLKGAAIAICLDDADADLRILENYVLYGIKNYRAYVSQIPYPGTESKLRIVSITFTEAVEPSEIPFPQEAKDKLRPLVKERHPELTDAEFESLISSLDIRFLRALPPEHLVVALDMF